VATRTLGASTGFEAEHSVRDGVPVRAIGPPAAPDTGPVAASCADAVGGLAPTVMRRGYVPSRSGVPVAVPMLHCGRDDRVVGRVGVCVDGDLYVDGEPAGIAHASAVVSNRNCRSSGRCRNR
jgi:hypothetical protein